MIMLYIETQEKTNRNSKGGFDVFIAVIRDLPCFYKSWIA